MPIPNATVAATTFTAPTKKSMCVFFLCDGDRRAWYTPTESLDTNLARKASHTASVSRTDGQYTMTDPFASRTASAMRLKSVSAPRFFATRTKRLGRSQLFTATNGSLNPNTLSISSLTAPTAVAVSAMSGTSPFGARYKRSASSARYAARKSCPHCDTQCASSTATRPSVFASTISRRRRTKYVGSVLLVSSRAAGFVVTSSSSSTKPTSFSGVT